MVLFYSNFLRFGTITQTCQPTSFHVFLSEIALFLRQYGLREKRGPDAGPSYPGDLALSLHPSLPARWGRLVAWPAGNGVEVGWLGGTQGRSRTQTPAWCSPAVRPGGSREMRLKRKHRRTDMGHHHGSFLGLSRAQMWGWISGVEAKAESWGPWAGRSG